MLQSTDAERQGDRRSQWSHMDLPGNGNRRDLLVGLVVSGHWNLQYPGEEWLEGRVLKKMTRKGPLWSSVQSWCKENF